MAPRPRRSNANVVVDDLDAYADRLEAAAATFDAIHTEAWLNQWGEELAATLRDKAPEQSGDLKKSIRHEGDGGISIGKFYWRFLEDGTSKMAPRPFVVPSIKKIRTPARKDAIARMMDVLER